MSEHNPDLLPQSNPENPVSDAGPDRSGDPALIQKATQIFNDSTTYLESSVRKNWERNLANWMNKHPPGSKYDTKDYRSRSKIFRPRTRYGIRSNEAAAATALFSNSDLISVTAENAGSANAAAAAGIQQGLLQYRLSRTIPWFLTAMGAFQDTEVYGICASYNYWHYEAVDEDEPPPTETQTTIEQNEEAQEPAPRAKRVLHDKPCIDLLAPENLRFDPAADWRDPINSSPYCIRIVPMYIGEVMEKAANGGGAIPWRPFTMGQLQSAKTDYYDSTRRAREESRVDPAQAQTNKETLVWLHENFVKKGGRDYVFWTVGTTLVLSDMVPIEQVYPHLKGKQRPITMGMAVLEAHRTYPSGVADLTAGLQEATNDTANQRLDNVRLAMNKRYFIKRGQQIDLDNLMRSVPGGGIMVDNPETDVRVVDTPDVTSSSYQETDRFDNAIDEMHGVFSGSTVQSNRGVGETVGGMKLLDGSANAISDYSLRTFVETWVEPTLRQLVLMEAYYEDDQNVIAIAAEQSKFFQKFNVDAVTDEMLSSEVTLAVNVGIGATNPQQKVTNLGTAFGAISQVAPDMLGQINGEEVIKEVMGSLGYKDGARFFKPVDPNAQQPEDPAVTKARMELEFKAQDAEANRQHELAMKKMELTSAERLGYAELALKEGISYATLRSKLRMDAEKQKNTAGLTLIKDRTQREVAALKGQQANNELKFKATTGREGI
ncbi:hypothetical protein [Sphingomonas sp.]|jgi:hypothetical protein|uniref:portal protein n=1 Tax=Sphingomonas sp. TaxID=28214 RepID=UPI0035676EC2